MEGTTEQPVRGDYSLAELRGMITPAAPPAAADTATKTPSQASEPGTSTETQQNPNAAQGQQPRSEDGKFKGKAPEEREEGGPAGVQKRIDKAVRAQRDAERRAKEAEDRLAAQQGQQTESKPPAAQQAQQPAQQPAAAPAKPKAEDFTTYEEYVEALTDWKADVRDLKKREADAKNAAEAREREVLTTHASRIEKAKAEIPDWQETIDGAASLPISREMHVAIVESEQGPQIAYHLAKHPEEAARIYALSPTRQIAELGRLEATLTAPAAQPAAEKPRLPKPPANVGGTASAATEPKLDDAKLPMSEFKRLAAAGLKRR